MPFRSEKQRRYLWATHPELAKKWAKDYPESNKNLPMYAKANSEDENMKKADVFAVLRAAIGNNLTNAPNQVCTSESILGTKLANSKMEHVVMPTGQEPYSAGEKHIEKKPKPEAEDEGSIGQSRTENATANPPCMQETPLVNKLAAVLAPRIQQAIENERAMQAAREAVRVPQNVNVKRYAMPSANIPPPIGMAQAPAPAQPTVPSPTQPPQPQQNGLPSVNGKGGSPQSNPINSFGGISMSGAFNGNASLGTANAPGTKMAMRINDRGVPEFTSQDLIHGGVLGLAAGIPAAMYAYQQHTAKKKPGVPPVPAAWNPPTAPKYDPDADEDNYDKQQDQFKKLLRQYLKTKGYSKIQQHYYEPGGTPWSMLGPDKKYREIWMPEDGEPVNEPALLEDMYDFDTPDKVYRKGPGLMMANKTAAQKCSCGCGQKVNECTCPESCSCRQKGGSCYGLKKQAGNNDVLTWLMSIDSPTIPDPDDLDYDERMKSAAIGLWDRIRAKKERGGKPAKPGDKDYPDAKSWKKVTSISEKKSASSPAWQRSAGKNEEGGLNAKGRASYNRATGGNLKAPVTESNPKGDRAKRQNSFCSRMCGMKRVNTGAKTKKDPDSRINKSLRKWNCKCSAASMFGAGLGSQLQKQAGASMGRILGTALASTGGGLLVGGYPGWKLQRASENAGNHEFVNFIAGKAPIALAGAMAAGLYNNLYDRYVEPPKKEPKPEPESVAKYLQYLVH